MGIENSFGVAKKEDKKVNLDDVFLFGSFLSGAYAKIWEKARKTKVNIAKELGINISTLNHWEDGTSFPGEVDKDGKPIEEVLALIARVYELDIEELKKAYVASKLAREKEKESLKSLKKKGREAPAMEGIWGDGGNKGKRVRNGDTFSRKF